jgi:hypothetical protein
MIKLLEWSDYLAMIYSKTVSFELNIIFNKLYFIYKVSIHVRQLKSSS